MKRIPTLPGFSGRAMIAANKHEWGDAIKFFDATTDTGTDPENPDKNSVSNYDDDGQLWRIFYKSKDTFARQGYLLRPPRVARFLFTGEGGDDTIAKQVAAKYGDQITVIASLVSNCLTGVNVGMGKLADGTSAGDWGGFMFTDVGPVPKDGDPKDFRCGDILDLVFAGDDRLQTLQAYLGHVSINSQRYDASGGITGNQVPPVINLNSDRYYFWKRGYGEDWTQDSAPRSQYPGGAAPIEMPAAYQVDYYTARKNRVASVYEKFRSYECHIFNLKVAIQPDVYTYVPERIWGSPAATPVELGVKTINSPGDSTLDFSLCQVSGYWTINVDLSDYWNDLKRQHLEGMAADLAEYGFSFVDKGSQPVTFDDVDGIIRDFFGLPDEGASSG